ncbi:Hypothetical protein A7982_00196 [Minicystis rosea]|nr:Hypothetical protein A7982_00196 [Minicystis rosea]
MARDGDGDNRADALASPTCISARSARLLGAIVAPSCSLAAQPRKHERAGTASARARS